MIVLIACCGLKLKGEHLVKDIYQSALFKKSLQYARTVTDDTNIYILSAKYGVLSLTEKISDYDLTLAKMRPIDRQVWASRVMKQLRPLGKDFIMLAGILYYKDLRGIKFELPLDGLTVGYRLQKLQTLINKNVKSK